MMSLEILLLIHYYFQYSQIRQKTQIKTLKISLESLIEATTRFELVIRVLQTHALPLGYVAEYE